MLEAVVSVSWVWMHWTFVLRGVNGFLSKLRLHVLGVLVNRRWQRLSWSKLVAVEVPFPLLFKVVLSAILVLKGGVNEHSQHSFIWREFLGGALIVLRSKLVLFVTVELLLDSHHGSRQAILRQIMWEFVVLVVFSLEVRRNHGNWLYLSIVFDRWISGRSHTETAKLLLRTCLFPLFNGGQLSRLGKLLLHFTVTVHGMSVLFVYWLDHCEQRRRSHRRWLLRQNVFGCFYFIRSILTILSSSSLSPLFLGLRNCLVSRQTEIPSSFRFQRLVIFFIATVREN
jgi:hypothetical protein